MRILRFASMLTLLLPSLAATPAARARAAEQSASGVYQFSLEGRYAKYVEFSARTQAGGGATGEFFFRDEAEITFQDVDGVGDPQEKHEGFFLRAEFDGLVVSGNRAVMSGKIIDSTIRGLLGKRVLLTVEDNGNNAKEPDRLTWGVYQPAERGWTPSDAELEKDPGVGLRWHATDAEDEKDPGYEMPRDDSISTQSFPLSSYDFASVAEAAGDIVVQP